MKKQLFVLCIASSLAVYGASEQPEKSVDGSCYHLTEKEEELRKKFPGHEVSVVQQGKNIRTEIGGTLYDAGKVEIYKDDDSFDEEASREATENLQEQNKKGGKTVIKGDFTVGGW